jgi:hyperosmotically inducible protein
MARAALIIVLLVAVAFLAFVFWSGAPAQRAVENGSQRPTATTGIINTAAARERAAEVGEKAALATAKVEETVSEARLTTKIKAKMALDDFIRSRAIDVSTTGTTVTLSGQVGSVEEHDRAVRLARETVGVSQIVDRLQVGR